jgi:hypothetical protein
MRDKEVLYKAYKDGIIDDNQRKSLFEMFVLYDTNNKGFNLSNLLYYFGGFLAIMAVTIFMTLSYESFQEGGLLVTSSLLFVIGLFLSKKYLKEGNDIPSGVFAAFSLCLVPLILYCVQVLIGMINYDYQEYHKYIRWNWVYMELGTLFVASIMLYKMKFPFMMFPVSVTLWYLSMDLALLLSGRGYYDFELRKTVSLIFGLIMISFAFYVSYRGYKDKDYSFWLYMFGVICFWSGLSLSDSGSEFGKFLYFMINILMMITGVIIARKVFTVFGAIGSILYIGYLAQKVFEDELLFSISLIAVGFIIIKLGMLWNKNGDIIERKIRSIFPNKINVFVNKIRL